MKGETKILLAFLGGTALGTVGTIVGAVALRVPLRDQIAFKPFSEREYRVNDEVMTGAELDAAYPGITAWKAVRDLAIGGKWTVIIGDETFYVERLA